MRVVDGGFEVRLDDVAGKANLDFGQIVGAVKIVVYEFAVRFTLVSQPRVPKADEQVINSPFCCQSQPTIEPWPLAVAWAIVVSVPFGVMAQTLPGEPR